ncbi:unnamed protein product [Absidia cylindrospora]
MKHYIDLLYKKCKDGVITSDEIYEVDDENSWTVSYKKDVNCFFCEKRSTGKVTKMTNVENFISIWNYDMHNEVGKRGGVASISVYVESGYYSGYEGTYRAKIPVDIIPKYISLLKDIHEESDKDDEKADAEDYNIV